eukprot:g18050.t1
MVANIMQGATDVQSQCVGRMNHLSQLLWGANGGDMVDSTRSWSESTDPTSYGTDLNDFWLDVAATNVTITREGQRAWVRTI